MMRFAFLSLLLAACESPTELMLVVDADPALKIGSGLDIDSLRIEVQPAAEAPQVFFFSRSVGLCAVDDSGKTDCRPQQYADQDYTGALSFPIRFLLQPGSSSFDADVRVWVDASRAGTPRLSDGVRFQFVRGHRLWLDVPLYYACLDQLSCQATDEVCNKAAGCSVVTTTTGPSVDDIGSSVTDMHAGGDLAGVDLAHVDLARTDLARPDLAGVDLGHRDLAEGIDLAHPDMTMSSSADLAHRDLALSTQPDMTDMTMTDLKPSTCGTPGGLCCPNGMCNDGTPCTPPKPPPPKGSPAAKPEPMSIRCPE